MQVNLELLDSLDDIKIKQVVLMHKLSYERNHFSSRLPFSLLESFYKHILRGNKYSYTAIDEESGKVLGVLIAGDKTSEYVKIFIEKKIYILALILLINPDLIFAKFKDFISLFKNNKKHFNSKIYLRLLNLTVNREFQRNGIGLILLERFEYDLKKNGEGFYGFSVKKNNLKAINFYYKNNSYVEFENKDMIYFVKKISDQY